MGGTSTDGPATDLEFNVIGAVGAGLDVRLGSRWRAGVHGSVVWNVAELSNSGSSGSADVGLYVSYSWKPGD